MRILLRTLLVLWGITTSLFGSNLQAGKVVTLAGTGVEGYSGNAGPANKAQVGGPFGVTVGPDDAIYLCEISNHIIRRIDPKTNSISNVAGSRIKGYSGDGGPATQAQLNEPYEVRFDAQGNMFFVEMMNHLVRRVDAKTGLISTVAGTGEKGFSGDGGPAQKAKLHRPHSITLDNRGGLYICDIGNHRVRKVDLKTGIIATLIGTGMKKKTPNGATLEGTPVNGPRALDFDGKQNLFLALREGNAVFRIDLNTNTIHHLAGTGKKGYTGDGGDAKLATLAGPKGIAVGPRGNVYLADTENHVIRVIDRKTGHIQTIVGNGQLGDGPDGNPTSCKLARPHGVFVDTQGQVLIGDSSNHRLRRYTP